MAFLDRYGILGGSLDEDEVAYCDAIAMIEGKVPRNAARSDDGILATKSAPLSGSDDDIRRDAFSSLLASEAGKHAAVVGVRRDVLKSKLLSFSVMAAWIERRGQYSLWLSDKTSGVPTPPRPTGWAVIPIPATSTIGRTENRRYKIDPQLRRSYIDHTELEARFLHYLDPSQRRRVLAVSPDSVLDQVRCAGEYCAETFGWTLPQATVFLLTGHTPLVPPINVRVESKPLTGCTRLVLNIDPRTPPARVAAEYTKAKHKLAGRRTRWLSTKHLRLAEFCTRYAGDKDWGACMDAWNQAVKSKSERYKGANVFKRDALEARRKLLQPSYVTSEFP